MEGGINTNGLPDRVSVRLDRRMIPEESPADVERELRDLIKGAARNAAGIEVEIRRILLARPLTPLKGGERLVKRLAARASQVMGEPGGAKGVPPRSEGRRVGEECGRTCVRGGVPR